MQSNVKQGNFMLIDSYSNLIEEEEDKLIEELIPKFDDGELVDNKNIICDDKCIIVEEQHKLICLPCSMNENGCDEVPLIEKIEHEKPLEKFINMKKLAGLGTLEIEKR